MNFQIKIRVDGLNEPVVLRWSAEELQDINRLHKHLVEEFEVNNPDFADDWEVVEDPAAPFWVKSPGEVVNKDNGHWLASDIDGRDEEALLGWVRASQVVMIASKDNGHWLASDIDGRDEEALLGWVRASQVVMIARGRNLDPAVMLRFAFSVGVKDPVKFAEEVNLPVLVEEWWKEFFQDQED